MIAAFMTAFTASAQTDATLNKVSETYTLNTDGSMEYNYSKVMTYNTHYSFFSLFGETFVVYNPEYQDLKINHCYTIQKDGTRVDAPENAFNKVLPKPAADAPAYNHLTEMVITHTGLELGATVYLDYTITTKPGMFESLDIDRTLSVPGANIKEYKVTVNIPENRKLTWKLTDSKVRPTVNKGHYTWTFRNLPGGAGEAYAPENSEGLPRLTATTSESLAASLIPLTMETRDLCRLPSGVLDNTSDDSSKAQAIQKFIVSGLGNCGVEPEWAGYRNRQCAEILRSAYGTVSEKALAMARLMRSEGLDAEVIVVYPADAVKSLKTIKNYIVRCNGEYYSASSVSKIDPALRSDRDGYYDLQGNKVEIEAKARRLSSSTEVTVTKETVLPSHAGYSIYSVPAGEGIDTWKMRALHQKRIGMCEVPYMIEEENSVRINTEGVKWIGKTAEKTIENKAGCIRISITEDGNGVNVRRYIRLDKSLFTPSEYAALRELLLEWENRNFRELVFTVE